MEAIQMFRASDGELFNSHDEAQSYERVLSRKAEINAFVETLYPKKEGRRNPPARSIAESALVAWVSRNG